MLEGLRKKLASLLHRKKPNPVEDVVARITGAIENHYHYDQNRGTDAQTLEAWSDVERGYKGAERAYEALAAKEPATRRLVAAGLRRTFEEDPDLHDTWMQHSQHQQRLVAQKEQIIAQNLKAHEQLREMGLESTVPAAPAPHQRAFGNNLETLIDEGAQHAMVSDRAYRQMKEAGIQASAIAEKAHQQTFGTLPSAAEIPPTASEVAQNMTHAIVEHEQQLQLAAPGALGISPDKDRIRSMQDVVKGHYKKAGESFHAGLAAAGENAEAFHAEVAQHLQQTFAAAPQLKEIWDKPQVQELAGAHMGEHATAVVHNVAYPEIAKEAAEAANAVEKAATDLTNASKKMSGKMKWAIGGTAAAVGLGATVMMMGRGKSNAQNEQLRGALADQPAQAR